MNELQRLGITAIAAWYTTLLLMQGTIFNRPRQWLKGLHPKLKELTECPLCLGWWVAVSLSVAAGIWNPVSILAVVGVAHLLYLFVAKHLPCDGCSKQVETDGWTIKR